MKKIIWITSGFLGISLAFCALLLLFSFIKNSGHANKEPVEASEWILLCQTEENIDYDIIDDSLVRQEADGAMSYILWLKDQIAVPNKVMFTFSTGETHQVIWLDQNDNIISSADFREGEWEESVPEEAYRAVYTTYHAEEKFDVIGIGGYEPETTKLSGKYFSVLGDSVSSYKDYIPVQNNGYYSSDDFGVQSMWWAVAAKELGMVPCVINASGGTGVTELYDQLDYPTAGNSERCTQLSRGGTSPDIILVLMGGNDILKGVSYDNLESSYEEMVEKMKIEYPEAEIYLCTYYLLPGEYEKMGSSIADLVSAVADATDVYYMDLEGCDTLSSDPEKYFIDYNAKTGIALHANELGQEIYGKYIARMMLKNK